MGAGVVVRQRGDANADARARALTISVSLSLSEHVLASHKKMGRRCANAFVKGGKQDAAAAGAP
jgi:hypothetical protein